VNVEGRSPLVTIITITRNHREGLARTLASAAEQTFGDFEHVVVDGASTDGSRELLAASPSVRFVSEPDEGIAHAFNKGIAMSRGRWLNFLNAGDTWVDRTALARAAPYLSQGAIVTAHSVTHGVVNPPCVIPADAPMPRRAWLSHQASFFRRDVFAVCGDYDTRFRICMDYEFWLRALPRFPHRFLPEVLVDFEAGGVSSTRPDLWRRKLAQANRMHLPHAGLVNLRIALRHRLHRALRSLGLFDRYRALRLARGATPAPRLGGDRQPAAPDRRGEAAER
jgi:glycosyltransferase involved in cell wall biosynthesis